MNQIKITPELLAELKDKAEKATPGPWEQHEHYPLIITDYVFNPICEIYKGRYTDQDGVINAAYIAAANPQIVLALIAYVEQLKKENTELCANNYGPEILNDPQALTVSYFAGAMAEGRKNNVEIDNLKAQLSKLKAGKATLEKEADWLADYLCDIACTRDVKPCDKHETCRECWRQAAREGVKKSG